MATRLSGLVIAMALCACGASYAAENSYPTGMTEKAARGIVNVATGWVELPMQVKKGYDHGINGIEAPAGSRSLGAFLGLFRGVSHTVGRTAWGAANLSMFWAPNPTDNRDLLLLLDDNYAWQEGTKKTFFCPSMSSGVERVALRIQRGMNNAVGSFMEIPGQISKHHRTGCWWTGIPKGVYYTVSRFGNGVADLVLFPVPSPVDNLMVPFEEIHPWDAWEGRYYSNVE